MKETYSVNDIKVIVNCGKTKAYELLHKIQEQFKEEFPNSISMTNRVPVWYFNERILGIKEERRVIDEEKTN